MRKIFSGVLVVLAFLLMYDLCIAEEAVQVSAEKAKILALEVDELPISERVCLRTAKITILQWVDTGAIFKLCYHIGQAGEIILLPRSFGYPSPAFLGAVLPMNQV